MTNLELPMSRRALDVSVPIEIIKGQKSASAAFCLALQASGLEDKEVYLSLGIDAGHFSRIKKGEAGFPPDKMTEFCGLVGNTIYPEWIAYQVNCTLMLIKTEAERRAEEAEKRASHAELQVKLLKEMLIGRAA